MKHYCLPMIIVGMLLTGCGLQSLKTFKAENPGYGVIGVDENKDGQTDTYVVTKDGVTVTDADGRPVEVNGVREEIAAATLFTDELMAWGTALNIPLLGLAGLLWRRLSKLRQSASEVIESVQNYRNTLAPAAKANMNAKIGVVSKDARNLVTQVKESLK